MREKLEDAHLRKCLQVFREPIDFSLEAAVPVPKPFAETISNRIEAHKTLIEEPEMAIINKVFELVSKKKAAKKKEHGATEGKGKEKEPTKEDKKKAKRQRRRRLMNNSAGHFFDAEKVQEQEQEREQQQEQEVSIIIISMLSINTAYYSKNKRSRLRNMSIWHTAATRRLRLLGNSIPFEAERLSHSSTTRRNSISTSAYNVQDFRVFNSLTFFFVCHTNRRPPLPFEDYLLVSDNYFDKRWTGARRIKNVVMVLEWIPSGSRLSTMPPRDVNAITEKQHTELRKAFALFDQHNSGSLGEDSMRTLIRSAIDCMEPPSSEQMAEVMKAFATSGTNVDFEHLKLFLQSGKFREEQNGRYYVTVSLAEAETIRRIMHIRLERQIIGTMSLLLALLT